MQLYKNVSPDELERFKQIGEIQVSNIEFYRKVYDSSEGVKTLKIEPDEIIHTSYDELWLPENISIRNGYVQIDPGASVSIGEVQSNQLVYPLSERVFEANRTSHFCVVDANRFRQVIFNYLKSIYNTNLLKWEIVKMTYGEYKETMRSMDEFSHQIQNLKSDTFNAYAVNPHHFDNVERELRIIFYYKDETNLPEDGIKVIEPELKIFCEFPV